MKKILAMILALGMITCSFAACGSSSSDDEQDESSQTMTLELLKNNNSIAKLLFTYVNSSTADIIVEGGKIIDGTYEFDLSDAAKTEGQEIDLKKGAESEDEMKTIIEIISWKGLKDETDSGRCVVQIANGEVHMACYADSLVSSCAGVYPNPKTEVPSFNITDIPEEYKQVPSYDDDDEGAGVMD